MRIILVTLLCALPFTFALTAQEKVVKAVTPNRSAAQLKSDIAPRAKGTQLGVVVGKLPKSLSGQLDLPDGIGFLVRSILKGSPAEEAGILKHDVLVKLEDQWLVNGSQLAVLLNMRSSGETVNLSLYRKGKMVTVPLMLKESHYNVASAVPDRNFEELLQQSRSPIKVADASERVVSVDYAKGKVQLGRQEGTLYLTVKNTQGTMIFQAPVGTPEDLAKVPEQWRIFVPILTKALDDYKPRRRPRIVRPRIPSTPNSKK